MVRLRDAKQVNFHRKSLSGKELKLHLTTTFDKCFLKTNIMRKTIRLP